MTDPIGDTYDVLDGEGDVEHDISSFSVSTTDSELLVEVSFTDSVSPGNSGASDAVVGFIDLDVDRNASTGISSTINTFSPYDNNLGVDIFVELFSFDSISDETPVVDARSFEIIGQADIDFFSNGFTVRIPLSLLDVYGGPPVNAATVLGTVPEPTDAAPNGGFVTTGEPQSTPPDLEGIEELEQTLFEETRSTIQNAEDAAVSSMNTLVSDAGSFATEKLFDELLKPLNKFQTKLKGPDLQDANLQKKLDDRIPKLKDFLKEEAAIEVTALIAEELVGIIFKASGTGKTIFEVFIGSVETNHQSFKGNIDTISSSSNVPIDKIKQEFKDTSSFASVIDRKVNSFEGTLNSISSGFSATGTLKFAIEVGGGAFCVLAGAASASLAAAPCVATVATLSKGATVTQISFLVWEWGFYLSQHGTLWDGVSRAHLNYQNTVLDALNALESGKLNTSEGAITATKAPTEVTADEAASFSVTFRNTGDVKHRDVQANLKIENKNGKTVRNIKGDKVQLAPHSSHEFEFKNSFMNSLFDKLKNSIGLFSQGEHTAEFEILFGQEAASKRRTVQRAFNVDPGKVNIGKSVSHFVGNINPFSIESVYGLQSARNVKINLEIVNNKGSKIDKLSVIDELPKFGGNDLSKINFLTEPSNIFPKDRKVEWVIDLQPNESRTIEYIVDVSSVAPDKTLDFPAATIEGSSALTGDGGEVSSNSVEKSVTELSRTPNGSDTGGINRIRLICASTNSGVSLEIVFNGDRTNLFGSLSCNEVFTRGKAEDTFTIPNNRQFDPSEVQQVNLRYHARKDADDPEFNLGSFVSGSLDGSDLLANRPYILRVNSGDDKPAANSSPLLAFDSDQDGNIETNGDDDFINPPSGTKFSLFDPDAIQPNKRPTLQFEAPQDGDGFNGSVGSFGKAIEKSAQSLTVTDVQVNARGSTYQVHVQGQGIASTSITVYDLTGRQMAAETAKGSTVRLRGRPGNGPMLANNVYLYRVTIEGMDGSTVSTNLRKIVVLP